MEIINVGNFNSLPRQGGNNVGPRHGSSLSLPGDF